MKCRAETEGEKGTAYAQDRAILRFAFGLMGRVLVVASEKKPFRHVPSDASDAAHSSRKLKGNLRGTADFAEVGVSTGLTHDNLGPNELCSKPSFQGNGNQLVFLCFSWTKACAMLARPNKRACAEAFLCVFVRACGKNCKELFYCKSMFFEDLLQTGHAETTFFGLPSSSNKICGRACSKYISLAHSLCGAGRRMPKTFDKKVEYQPF